MKIVYNASLFQKNQLKPTSTERVYNYHGKRFDEWCKDNRDNVQKGELTKMDIEDYISSVKSHHSKR